MKNRSPSEWTLALAALGAAACAARAPAPRRALDRVEASQRLSLAGDLAEAESILWPGLRASAGAERARLLVQLGRVRTNMFWRWDVRLDLAADPLADALALAERTADADLLADAHDAVGMVAYSLMLFRGDGRWDEIEARFARALGLARDDGRRAGIRFHLGLVRQMQGDLDGAGRHFDASLALARAAGDDQVAGEDLRHLAAIASARGDRARAIALHLDSLRLRQRIGNRPGVATAHLALGELHLEAGDEASARRHLEPAYRIAREVGLGYAQVAAAAALARLEVRAGRAGAARALVDRAELLARYRRDDADLTQALLAAAEVSAAQGDAGRARAQLEEARSAAARSGDPDIRRAVDDTARRLVAP